MQHQSLVGSPPPCSDEKSNCASPEVEYKFELSPNSGAEWEE
jgi:hypothetical protein